MSVPDSISDVEEKPAALAVLGGHFETLELLLDVPGINVNLLNVSTKKKLTNGTTTTTLLWNACSKGNLPSVDFLLKRQGIDVNAGYCGPAPASVYHQLCATSEGRTQFVYSPLHAACQENNADVVYRMCRHSDVVVDINAIYEAFDKQHTEVMLALWHSLVKTHGGMPAYSFLLEKLNMYFEAGPETDFFQIHHDNCLEWLCELLIDDLQQKVVRGEPSSKAGSDTKITCIKEHGLVRFQVQGRFTYFTCDVCKKDLGWANDVIAFGCNMCGYDLCRQCEVSMN